jgi:D-aminoacyl-tRNA deacylase
MKFLIVGSKSDPASRNIVMQLMDLDRFNFYFIDGDMLDSNQLDHNILNKYDLVIFASRHKSDKPMKTLSIHSPGNFKEVWGGGKAGRLGPASALFNKYLFETLKKEVDRVGLNKYNVTLECTHHGPLIDVPSVFIEIGGGEMEWKDRRASFVVAKAIREAISTYKTSDYLETAIAIGGPHYCPAFNKIQENSNVAIAHVIPKYVAPITEKMILEAFNQTVEEIDFAILDWKGLGKSEERQAVIDILEKNYISWKRVSEIR